MCRGFHTLGGERKPDFLILRQKRDDFIMNFTLACFLFFILPVFFFYSCVDHFFTHMCVKSIYLIKNITTHYIYIYIKVETIVR